MNDPFGAFFEGFDASRRPAREQLNRECCRISVELYEAILPELLAGHGIVGAEATKAVEFFVSRVRKHFESLPLNPPDPYLALQHLPALTANLEQNVRREIAATLQKPWADGFGPITNNPN